MSLAMPEALAANRPSFHAPCSALLEGQLGPCDSLPRLFLDLAELPPNTNTRPPEGLKQVLHHSSKEDGEEPCKPGLRRVQSRDPLSDVQDVQNDAGACGRIEASCGARAGAGNDLLQPSCHGRPSLHPGTAR